MRIVKYEKESCPNCRRVERHCVVNGYIFDETIDAINGLEKEERLRLQIRMAPTIIAFNEDGTEIARVFGPDLAAIDKLFEMRDK